MHADHSERRNPTTMSALRTALAEQYARVRATTVALAAPLSAED